MKYMKMSLIAGFMLLLGNGCTHEPPAMPSERALVNADVDQDGFFTLSEIQRCFGYRVSERTADGAIGMWSEPYNIAQFKYSDKNGDDLLSREELNEMMTLNRFASYNFGKCGSDSELGDAIEAGEIGPGTPYGSAS